MSVRSAAAGALAAAEGAAAVKDQSDRDSLRAAAIAALRGVLATADGTPAVALSSLTVELVDLGVRLVVVTDPASVPPVSLGVVDEGGAHVTLVGLVDGGWTRLSGPLPDLAALGVALAAQEG